MQHSLLHNILCREQLVLSAGVHLIVHILQFKAQTAQLQERWETKLVVEKATWNLSGRDISNKFLAQEKPECQDIK